MFFYTSCMRARVPFPEMGPWLRYHKWISFCQFCPTVWLSSQVCPLSFFFTIYFAPFHTSPSSVVSVRDSIAPLFSLLPTKSDYINNYLSITLCYILVSCLTRQVALNRLTPLGICPRQRTGLHQVIHTPSCLRRHSLNTFYKSVGVSALILWKNARLPHLFFFLCRRWNRVGVHSEQFDKGSDWAERKERKSRVCQIQLIFFFLLIKRFPVYVTVQKLIDRCKRTR